MADEDFVALQAGTVFEKITFSSFEIMLRNRCQCTAASRICLLIRKLDGCSFFDQD